VADAVGSVVLVARINAVGGFGSVAGAVYNPVEVMVPEEADHVTATFAVKPWVPLRGRFAD